MSFVELVVRSYLFLLLFIPTMVGVMWLCFGRAILERNDLLIPAMLVAIVFLFATFAAAVTVAVYIKGGPLT